MPFPILVMPQYHPRQTVTEWQSALNQGQGDLRVWLQQTGSFWGTQHHASVIHFWSQNQDRTQSRSVRARPDCSKLKNHAYRDFPIITSMVHKPKSAYLDITLFQFKFSSIFVFHVVKLGVAVMAQNFYFIIKRTPRPSTSYHLTVGKFPTWHFQKSVWRVKKKKKSLSIYTFVFSHRLNTKIQLSKCLTGQDFQVREASGGKSVQFLFYSWSLNMLTVLSKAQKETTWSSRARTYRLFSPPHQISLEITLHTAVALRTKYDKT